MVYLQLFYTFFKIGLLGFGGGYGMLSLIQFEIVEHYGWLTGVQFADIVAISQATPGPIGINSATFVGYTVGGIAGAIIATVALVAPSFILMYALIFLFDRFKENSYVKAVLNVMQYVVIGLIASAAVMLINTETFGENYADLFAWSIFAIAFVTMKFFKTNPIVLLIAGGLAGGLML